MWPPLSIRSERKGCWRKTRRSVLCIAAAAIILGGYLPANAATRRRLASPPVPAAGPPCSEGSIGDGGVTAAQVFGPLSAAEVDAIIHGAASALSSATATIAVVDRAGRVLAVFRQPGASNENDDQAVGVARTAAFFSHNMAPLSSRTVRFISGIHFPPGVTNAPNAALYGIENTNRGCDFGVTFNTGKAIPPAKSLSGGFGPGIVTGKVQPDDSDSTSVEAGGIPIYRAGKLVAGIGV